MFSELETQSNMRKRRGKNTKTFRNLKRGICGRRSERRKWNWLPMRRLGFSGWSVSSCCSRYWKSSREKNCREFAWIFGRRNSPSEANQNSCFQFPVEAESVEEGNGAFKMGRQIKCRAVKLSFLSFNFLFYTYFTVDFF